MTDEIGKRMKENYEMRSRTSLVRRMPVAIRIDGKAFHTFTKGMRKPFDDVLVNSMQDTMKYLCANIQGCVLGYTQSDEITLILIDYQNLDSCAWFDYEVQKVCSIASSMATLAFNKAFQIYALEYITKNAYSEDENEETDYGETRKYINTLSDAIGKGAMFDARCFNIPKEEVANLLLWRQLDAIRNSVEMVGHVCFSTKQLHKKSCQDIKEMLLTEKGIDWNEYPLHLQRGSCCKKVIVTQEGIERRKWIVDKEIPIFSENFDYINSLI